MNSAILATFETCWQKANSPEEISLQLQKVFFVCEVTRQVVVQCLSVLPTNLIHTLGRPNTGVHQHVNFTGGSSPAPNKHTHKKRQTDKEKQKRTLSSTTTDEHCSCTTAKGSSKRHLPTDLPYKRFTTKMHKNKPQTFQKST